MSQPLTPEDLKRIENTFCTTHLKKIYLKPQGMPSTVFDALIEIVPDMSREDHELLLSHGAVFVNGAPALQGSATLSAPVRIECYVPKFDLRNPEKFFPQFDPSWILYQDDFIVIAWKPKGLPTIPSREQRVFNLKTYLEKNLVKKIHMPSRLDMSTCGIVLVSIAERSNAPIQGLYEQHLVQKVYHLRSAGTLKEKTIVDAPIGKHPLHPVLRAVRNDADAKPALTHFSFLSSSHTDPTYQGTSLIEAKPITGRTHQIRVHAAHIGIPILGDNFYAGGIHSHGLHLMAYSLTFPHPITRKEMTITAPHTLIPEWAVTV